MTPCSILEPGDGRKIAYHTVAAEGDGVNLPGVVFLGGFKSDMGGTKAVFLDLWRGECRGAHMATDDDLSTADFVLAAPLDTWKLVLDSKLDPIFGVMTGKLKLARGNVAKLTPYMQASKDLVAAAAQIDTVFPD